MTRLPGSMNSRVNSQLGRDAPGMAIRLRLTGSQARAHYPGWDIPNVIW
jgi:hypothetical protein